MVLVSLYIPWKLQKIKRKILFLINRSICWMLYSILVNYIWYTISILSAAFIYYNSSLTHFLSLVSFFTPWKYKKTRGFFLVPFYTTCNQNLDVFRGYRKRLACNEVKLHLEEIHHYLRNSSWRENTYRNPLTFRLF